MRIEDFTHASALVGRIADEGRSGSPRGGPSSHELRADWQRARANYAARPCLRGRLQSRCQHVRLTPLSAEALGVGYFMIQDFLT